MLLLQCFVAFIIVMEFVSLLTNVSSIRLLLRLIYNIYIHMYVFIVYIYTYVYIIRYLLLKAAFLLSTCKQRISLAYFLFHQNVRLQMKSLSQLKYTSTILFHYKKSLLIENVKNKSF